MASKYDIERLYLFETGTYGDQVRRSFNMNVTGQALRILDEKLNGSELITPSQLAGVAGQILTPNAHSEGVIQIANGWNERRMRFSMKLKVSGNFGEDSIYNVQGFTDFVGATVNNSIAPDMQFYINSITQYRPMIIQTPGGPIKRWQMVDPLNVFSSETAFGANTAPIHQMYNTDTNAFRMRPADIAAVIPRRAALDDPSSYDDTVRQSNIPTLSKMSSAVPANYIAGILSGYKVASQQEFGGGSWQAIWSETRGYLADPVCAQNPLLAALSQIRSVASTSVFTYGDLMALDPSVAQKTKPFLIAPTQRSSVHYAGQTCDWSSAMLETQFATMLSQALPGIAMGCSLELVEFQSTNRVYGVPVQTLVTNAKSIVPTDLAGPCAEFVAKLNQYIMIDLSQGGVIDYMVSVKFDIANETRVTVQISTGPEMEFVTPSFACSMTTPLLTQTPGNLTRLAEGFEQLTGELCPSISNGLYGKLPGLDEGSGSYLNNNTVPFNGAQQGV